ncbi:radical SAM protein [Nocardia sp. NPDC060220]|uniref:radical SAM protein n=1 Tax=Nocardia sp. NPDC060220 TaxID=3347076 RepID=UPI00366455FF
MFDRATGLNVLVDEVGVPEDQWSVAPRQVSIAVTNACELTCSYCYAPKHRAHLNPKRLCEWMVELDDADTLGIGFGGGEPTVYRHITDVCIYAAEHTGLAVTMTTHGHNWDTDLVSRLRDAVNFVRISVDGTADTYERLRGRSFAELCARLDLIAESFRFGLNCVVNAKTVGQLTAVANLAAERGAAELLLLPERPTRIGRGAPREVLSQLEAWVLSYSGSVPLTISEDAAISLPIAVPFPNETGLRSYAHIDASGIAHATSYSVAGQMIGEDGVLAAFGRLATTEVA